MDFGENLKTLRESKGMSQAELAESLGITQSIIAQYEAGAKFPNVNLAAKIAKTLGVTVDTMLQKGAQ